MGTGHLLTCLCVGAGVKGIAIQLPLVQEQRPGAQGMGGSTFDGARPTQILLISNPCASCRTDLYHRQAVD